MDPYAKLAWGVDLGGAEKEWRLSKEWAKEVEGDYLRKVILDVAGFTESEPGIPVVADRAAWHEYWKAEQAFTGSHVFVKIEPYCSADYPGYLLVVGDVQCVDWDAEPVKTPMFIPLSAESLDQFAAVLDRIEYADDRTPKLFLASYYS